MLSIVRVACGVLLLWAQIMAGLGQLADPDFQGDSGFGEIFEVQPDTSLNHYYYPPRPPPRIRLVKKPAPSRSPPLQAVQKVFVAKPSPVGSTSSSYALGPVVLALILQAVGTMLFLVMVKLVLGMKTILATNTATLALALWSHLKKKKMLKLKKKKILLQQPHTKPVKIHKKKKKQKPLDHTHWVPLTKKQMKVIMKLLLKKKKNKN